MKAAWSESGHAPCKVIDIGSEKQIIVAPWISKPKKPNTSPLVVPRGWMSHAKAAEPVVETVEDEAMKTQPDPATQTTR